jgi:hypothetical protein
MALKKKGKYWYGTTPDDIQAEILRYSAQLGYKVIKFSKSICCCNSVIFELETDEQEGAARRKCVACGEVHLMGDSAEYAEGANFEGHECICNATQFTLMSGVALYEGSNDVRWYYIGCQCMNCQLIGVFADWKCEAGDADIFLAKV